MCDIEFPLELVFNTQNKQIHDKRILTQDSWNFCESSLICNGATPTLNWIKVCSNLGIKILIRNLMFLK